MNWLGLPETDAPEWVKTSCLSNRDMEGQVNVKVLSSYWHKGHFMSETS